MSISRLLHNPKFHYHVYCVVFLNPVGVLTYWICKVWLRIALSYTSASSKMVCFRLCSLLAVGCICRLRATCTAQPTLCELIIFREVLSSSLRSFLRFIIFCMSGTNALLPPCLQHERNVTLCNCNDTSIWKIRSAFRFFWAVLTTGINVNN